jgi:hypothetical protein
MRCASGGSTDRAPLSASHHGRPIATANAIEIGKKSVRFAATTFDEPIGSKADHKEREASASNRAGSAVNTTVIAANTTVFVVIAIR